MNPRNVLSVSLLLGAACASAGGGRGRAPAQVHQADERLPPVAAAFPQGDVRNAYNEALANEQRGWQAESAGKADEARQPLEAAARGYLGVLDHAKNSGWDLTLRYHAADLHRRAGHPDEAAALAQQLGSDPSASPKTRAMASLLAANSMVAQNQLEPIKIVPAAERKGEKPMPRPVPPAWNDFVQKTDAYLSTLDAAHPEPPDRTMTPGQLALIAARVQYGMDDMEGARSRLDTILQRWGSDPAVFQGAAPLYVETFLVPGDTQGAEQAVARVRDQAQTLAQQAQTQEARTTYEKVASETERMSSGVKYEQAKALLEQGRAADAAQAFEQLAQSGTGDTAAALSAGAIAWDKAGEGDKAAALRRRLLDEHADAKVTPGATLQLAAYLSKSGDHAGAARIYRLHAERWPDDASHCTALRNGAVELDMAKQAGPAAEQYRAFGSDASCAGASPDVAALALYRAGQLFLSAKQRPDAKEAFQAAADVKGVSSPDAKKRVADAQRQAKQLGGTAAGRRPPQQR